MPYRTRRQATFIEVNASVGSRILGQTIAEMSSATAAAASAPKDAAKEAAAPTVVLPTAEAIDEDDEFEEFKEEGEYQT